MSRDLGLFFAAAALAGCSLVVEPDLGPIAAGGTNECGRDPDCDDSDGCTDDQCLEGRCIHQPRDDDGDGFGREDCGGNDCDDGDPAIKPSALEACTDGADQDCDDQIDAADPDCGPGPDNDTCASPFELDADPPGGIGRVVGDTSVRTNDDAPGCAHSPAIGAPDVFFALPIRTPREVTFDTFESEFDTVVEVRTLCTDTAFALGCSGDVNARSDSKVVLRTVDTGIFVLVDGDEGGPMGRYVLNYGVRPVRPQLTCDEPMDVTGGAAIYGETGFDSFEDGQSGSCGGEGSAEEVFRLQVPEHTTLTAVTTGSNYDTVLYVRRAECDGGEEMDCRDAEGGTEETALDLDPGVYYVIVDGGGGTEGAYRLGLRVAGGL